MSNPSDDISSDEARARATRSQQRYTRDQQWTAAARAGDRQSFGRLVEAWLDPAHDRIVQFGIPADDRSAVLSGGFEDVRTELELGASAQFPSLLVRSLILRTGAPRPMASTLDSAAEQRAAERLTRGTDLRSVATDPSVAALLWEAAALLGPENRDILDLHWRHLLRPDEIAAGVEIAEDRVETTIRKLPEGFANVVRARLLWAGGQPRNKELATALKAAGVTTFDAKAVRTIHAQAKENTVLRAQALTPLAPAEIFAQIPIVSAPIGMRRDVILAITSGGGVGAEAEPFTPETDDQSNRSGAAVAGAAVAGAALGGAAVADAAEADTTEPAATPPADDRTAAEQARADKAAETSALVAAAAARKADGPTADKADDEPAEKSDDTTSSAPAAAAVGATAAAAGMSAAKGDEPDTAAESTDGKDDKKGAAAIGGAAAVGGVAGAAAASAFDPAAASASAPTSAFTPTPPPTAAATPPRPTGSGPVHAPISRDDGEDDGKRKKMVLAGAIAAAIVLLLGIGVVVAGGGDGDSADVDTASPTTVDDNRVVGSTSSTASTTTTTGAPEETSTTVLDESTTTSVAVIVAPTVPPTTVCALCGGGGGGGGGKTPTPPPTAPPAAAPSNFSANVSLKIVNGNPEGSANRSYPYWANSQVQLNYSASANYGMTATISGPGITTPNINASSGTINLCPNGDLNNCGSPGQYTYTIVWKFNGQSQSRSAVLFVAE